MMAVEWGAGRYLCHDGSRGGQADISAMMAVEGGRQADISAMMAGEGGGRGEKGDSCVVQVNRR